MEGEEKEKTKNLAFPFHTLVRDNGCCTEENWDKQVVNENSLQSRAPENCATCTLSHAQWAPSER